MSRKSKQNELCSRRNKRLDELIAEFNRSVPTMDVVDLLSDILTLSATEEIKCKEEAKGRTAANRLLCHRIRYCKNWYVRLVDALKKVELDELAQDLSRDENGSLMEEVEHIAGPIHRYDKQVALQDGVEDSTASSYELVVAARLSQSPKRTYYQSLAVKQPLENIDREVRKESLRDLSGEIEKECKDVGRKLGLDESKLYQLERDYINQGHKETVYQMLLTWKRRIGSQATHRVLGEALKAAGRRDLQEKLYVQGSLMEEVEHTGPIHRYDKQVALQGGVEDSAASSYDTLVAARLSQSPKRTYYQSLAVKQPLENIDRVVTTESLRDVSAPSLSGIPVPSQSADVPHSKKRCYIESTAALMGGVEDSAASSYDTLVAARLSQSPKRTYYQSLAVKQPLENIDREVRKESLLDLSRKIKNEWKHVGRNLGLDDSELCTLERDNTNNGRTETVYQMLLYWKQSNGSQATYRVLGEALIAAKRRDLQEKLYKLATIQNDN
ncbi:uncharacterized protein [Apostichopus japonicus]|uniref:uncharacterized protein isoform X5 n=1 Tax=Stichopus japonicus TaxID=307972 RepID=UPI003AB737E2